MDRKGGFWTAPCVKRIVSWGVWAVDIATRPLLMNVRL